jgi:hypothetical protein
MKGKKAAKGTSSETLQTASPNKSRSGLAQDALSIEGFWSHYSKITDTHTKIIDLFIIYLIAILGCQVFYRFVVGDDFPRNAFVSGTFCPIGVIVLLVIIRGRGRDLRQLAEFFLATLVLFITAINFAG